MANHDPLSAGFTGTIPAPADIADSTQPESHREHYYNYLFHY